MHAVLEFIFYESALNITRIDLCVCVCVTAGPVLMSLKEGYNRPTKLVFKAPVKEKKSVVVNGIDLLENVPPRTENEVPVLYMLKIIEKAAF